MEDYEIEVLQNELQVQLDLLNSEMEHGDINVALDCIPIIVEKCLVLLEVTKDPSYKNIMNLMLYILSKVVNKAWNVCSTDNKETMVIAKMKLNKLKKNLSELDE